MQLLPENERIIVDILRNIIIENLPPHCKEKISFSVPFFYGHKSICLVWPASVPRGGIKEGVLLGFWYGNQLPDKDNFLTRGNNKKIFYKIYTEPEQINVSAVIAILNEAVALDLSRTC